jgi:hypothetical protein
MALKKKGASLKKAPLYMRVLNPTITFFQNWYPIILIISAVVLFAAFQMNHEH